MDNYDYILVGQGIAGSILACRLIENNCNVLVKDELGLIENRFLWA